MATTTSAPAAPNRPTLRTPPRSCDRDRHARDGATEQQHAQARRQGADPGEDARDGDRIAEARDPPEAVPFAPQEERDHQERQQDRSHQPQGALQ